MQKDLRAGSTVVPPIAKAKKSVSEVTGTELLDLTEREGRGLTDQ